MAPYITSWERIALKKGLEQGMKQGKTAEARRFFLNALKYKFGDAPSWVIDKVKRADHPTIDTWHENLFSTDQIEQVFYGLCSPKV